MFDPDSEIPIFLVDVPDVLPRRNGKKIHVSTPHRWSTTGLRGVILSTFLIGGLRATTRQDLSNFFARVAEIRNSGPESHGKPAKSLRAAEEADRQLEREGF